MSLLFCSSEGLVCADISLVALEEIKNHIKHHHPFETGGVLIGQYDENCRLAKVHHATKPPPDSRHTYNSFFRGIKGLKETIRQSFHEGEQCYYIGDWHSHPSNSASPSKVDLIQMQHFARTREFGTITPLLLIVGGSHDTSYDFYVSVHYKAKKPLTLKEV